MRTIPQVRKSGLAKVCSCVVFTDQTIRLITRLSNVCVDRSTTWAYNQVMVLNTMKQIEFILLSLRGLCFIPVEANRD